jgi:hypothetical protein
MKISVFFILLTGLFACQNKPTEIAKIPVSIADSIKAYESRNLLPRIVLENPYGDDSLSITDTNSVERKISVKDVVNYTGPDGLKHGFWIETKDCAPGAKKIREGKYNNSLKNGVWTEYYENEKIKSKITYANGRLEGPAVFYDQKQNILMEGNYIKGVFVEKKNQIL